MSAARTANTTTSSEGATVSGTATTMVVDSPVGPLWLVANDDALTHVLFVDDEKPDSDAAETPILLKAKRQLEEYFAGARDSFDLPLDPHGTEFQRRVWAQLLEIPYGRTASYGEIAARLGMPPGGSRAVGLANGANPIAIVVQCHRVIGANGTLTGYAGGLERKKYLLDLESPGEQDALFG